MDDKLQSFLRELDRQISHANIDAICETYDDASSAGLISIHKEKDHYFHDLLALRARIYDSLEAQVPWDALALPSVVPAWKLLAFSRPSAAFLKPSYVFERFKDLQVVLNRQAAASSNAIYTQDIWEHKLLDGWITSYESSIIFLESAHRSKQRLDQFLCELIEHLTKHHSVSHILDIPLGAASGPLRTPTPESVLEQLTMQVLYFVTPKRPLIHVVENLHAFRNSRNVQDWIDLLFRACTKVQGITIVLDLRILRAYPEAIYSWPSIFARKVEEITTKSRDWVKMMFIMDEFQSFSYVDQATIIHTRSSDETTNWPSCFSILHFPQESRPRPSPPPVPKPFEGQSTSCDHTHPQRYGVNELILSKTSAEYLARSKRAEAPIDPMTDVVSSQSTRSTAFPPKTPADIRVAIICALTLEANAVEATFDHHWDRVNKAKFKAPGDKNSYSFGILSGHQVVLAYMPNMGKANSAMVASDCRNSFPKIMLVLVVGICGGVPFYADTENDTREIVLGDVIISEGIVVYDFGRQYPEGLVRRTGPQDAPGKLAPELQSFLNRLKGIRHCKKLRDKTSSILLSLTESDNGLFYHPGVKNDRLFDGTYRHKHHWPDSCVICLDQQESGICHGACSLTCEELNCDEARTVPRKRLEPPDPRIDGLPLPSIDFCPAIHFGLMASGDQVMKSGEHRDSMAKSERIIAFEMEAAGVWESFRCCVVIKGVCDYADSHKNKGWQTYAAATAASCTKAFLQEWCPGN